MANKRQLTPRLNRNEPNIIIDGGMEIWPEGTSRSVANNTSAYGSVLFKLANTSSSVTLTNSRQTSVPSSELDFSNQISKTAAGTLVAGTEVNMFYYVEGYDTQKLIKNQFSLIFWVKSSVASNRSFALRNTGATHSFVKQYSIGAANTWELKVLNFPALSTCPGTIDKTNGVGLFCNWSVITGTNKQTTTLNAWQSGNFLAGVGEDTTWLTGTNHDFSIAGVMVLPGDWTSLQTNTSAYTFLRAGRNFQNELEMTQRYFFKTYNLDEAPGTISTKGVLTTNMAPNTGSTASHCTCPYPTRLRGNPTITLYNPLTGATGTWRDSGGGDVAVGFTDNGTMVTGVSNTGAMVTFRYLIGHVVADARF